MRFEEKSEIRRSRRARRKLGSPRCFNLDLHIGVIPDVKRDLALQGVSLLSWSASAHNHLVEGRRPIPDPVRHVNSRTYQHLSTERIEKFQRRYNNLLQTFQGFVVTHTPTFAQLYSEQSGPVLMVISQRYEDPYTRDDPSWKRFNEFMHISVNRGTLVACANNNADADYLEYCSGLKVPVVPSLCDKNGTRWIGGTEKNLVFGRSESDRQRVQIETREQYASVASLGVPYRWSDILACREVFVLPTNVSLMTLFEFATAGVPVAIPSIRWMRDLINEQYVVLGELTFTQMLGVDTTNLSSEDPRNWKSESYLDWWMSRADYYDSMLMPNVRVVDSFEELVDGASTAERLGTKYHQIVESRNISIAERRTVFIQAFVEKMVS